MDASGWHARFTQQAGWTAGLRAYIYNIIGAAQAAAILDAGCGTGALLPELGSTAPLAALTGVDILPDRLAVARSIHPGAHFVCGDLSSLPFKSGLFDIALTHFVLLWLENPLAALFELSRTVHPGGWVCALAEPDFGGRIDHPPELAKLGWFQSEALRRQGADPNMGRKISGLFHQAGLKNIRSGLLGGEWSNPPASQAWNSEWAVLESDLAGQMPPQELHSLRRRDSEAWQNGERILFVPTFYAIGQV